MEHHDAAIQVIDETTRQLLDYCVQFWSSSEWKIVIKMDNREEKLIRLLPELAGLSYREWLNSNKGGSFFIRPYEAKE